MQYFDISTFAALQKSATILSGRFNKGIIYLEGNLGVGKTSFVACWLRSCGVREVVTSPTYSLVNEYLLPKGNVALHADLYRLSSPDELLFLDVDEWENRAKLVFIEWAVLGEGYLPAPSAICRLSLDGRQRMLMWQEV